MKRNLKICTAIFTCLVLVLCTVTIAFGAVAKKNPPTGEEHFAGPAILGTATVQVYSNTCDTETSLCDGEVCVNDVCVEATGFSEGLVRNSNRELLLYYPLPAWLSQALTGTTDALMVAAVHSVSHSETTGVGPKAEAEVIILRVVTK